LASEGVERRGCVGVCTGLCAWVWPPCRACGGDGKRRAPGANRGRDRIGGGVVAGVVADL